MNATPAYREQYERVKRWYARFQHLDGGRPHDAASENYVDDVYAFFMNCYHLKDWIQHDGTVPRAVRDSVENYINSDRHLQICGDICNSLKHLTLGRGYRSSENPAFGKKRYGLTLGAGPATISLKYEVNTANGPIDAFRLASACVAAWDDFLKKGNLA